MEKSPEEYEIENFYYAISHDFRAPLRSITGFSKILLEEESKKLSPEGKDYLNRICNAAQTMNLMMEGVLKLSRVVQKNPAKEKVSLAQILQGVSRDLNFVNSQQAVEFHYPSEVFVEWDYELLKILIHALLSNAWKFTRNIKNPKVEFLVSSQDGVVTYCVQDNGVGFDISQSKKLFNLFQRLHSVKDFEGVGAGLAIAKKIVHIHKGRIWAEGKANAGAQFYFTLGGNAT